MTGTEALLAVEPGYLQLVAFVGLADAVYTHYSGHKSFTLLSFTSSCFLVVTSSRLLEKWPEKKDGFRTRKKLTIVWLGPCGELKQSDFVAMVL